MIITMMMSLAGLVVRTGGNRGAYWVFLGKLDGKGLFGRLMAG
jgi:hypothetical protein